MSFQKKFLVSWFPYGFLVAARGRAKYFVVKKSVNQNKNGGILGGFDDLLKRFLLHIRLFQFRRHLRHRLQEAQEQTALHRVIYILRQRPGGRQRRRRIR